MHVCAWDMPSWLYFDPSGRERVEIKAENVILIQIGIQVLCLSHFFDIGELAKAPGIFVHISKDFSPKEFNNNNNNK